MPNTTQSTRGRSIWAVVAGLLFIVISHTLVDVVLHSTGVFPPWGQPTSDALLALAMAYRIPLSVAGCYLTARMAPAQPMKHALILGGIGVLLSGAGLIATWNGGPEFGAKWYPIALVVVSMPCAWLGGRLCEMQGKARTPLAT